jgi:hypothetical protein
MTTIFEPLSWVPDTAAELIGSPPPERQSRVSWRATDAIDALPGAERATTPVPRTIDYVDAREVQAHLTAVADELASLRERLVAVDRDADDAEARLDADGVRSDVSLVLATGFRRFLDELRAEADEDAVAMVAAARVEARLIRRAADPRAPIFVAARREHSRRVVTTSAAADVAPPVAWKASLAAEAGEGVDVVPDAPVIVDEVVVDPVIVVEPVVVEPGGVELPEAGDRDFWAAIDKADHRRPVRRMLGQTGLLRVGAGVCVVVAAVIHLV